MDNFIPKTREREKIWEPNSKIKDRKGMKKCNHQNSGAGGE